MDGQLEKIVLNEIFLLDDQYEMQNRLLKYSVDKIQKFKELVEYSIPMDKSGCSNRAMSLLLLLQVLVTILLPILTPT